MRFHATLELHGKTATGIVVPDDIVESLGAGKRPPVKVTIGSYTFRNTVAPMGGRFLLGISAEHRAAAGIKAGDDLDVDIELDSEPREVTVPADFSEALDSDAEARRSFDRLSYSAKRQHVLSIEGAKTEETRKRRIEKAMETLGKGGT